MTIIARTIGGREFTLAAAAGDTPKEVVERLTAQSLTGSAVPLADAELPIDGGGSIRYTDVDELTYREPA